MTNDNDKYTSDLVSRRDVGVKIDLRSMTCIPQSFLIRSDNIQG